MLELNFTPFPGLYTNRLLLRKLKLEDRHDIFEIRSNPDVMKYMARPVLKTVDEAKAHIEKVLQSLHENTSVDWGIEEKESKKLIGTFAFWRIIKEDYRAEIGYVLNKNWHNKGIMNEVFSAVIPFAFDKINLHSLEADIDPLNTASRNLLEKNKFRQEAYFRDKLFFEGTYIDSIIYSLVKSIDYK